MDEDLDFIINHVFLPPKLPQKDDSDDTKNVYLLVKLREALESFQAHIPEQQRLDASGSIANYNKGTLGSH